MQAAQAQFLEALPAAEKATITSAKVKYDCESTKGNLKETLHNIESKNQEESAKAKQQCDTALADYKQHKTDSLAEYAGLLSEERFTCEQGNPNRAKFFKAGYCEQYQNNKDQAVRVRDEALAAEQAALKKAQEDKDAAEQAAALAKGALDGATTDEAQADKARVEAEETQKSKVSDAKKAEEADNASNLAIYNKAHSDASKVLADAETLHAENKAKAETSCNTIRDDTQKILDADSAAFGKVSEDLNYLAQHSCATSAEGTAFIECASTKAKKILAGAGASTSLIETFASHKSRSDFAAGIAAWEQNQQEMKTQMINTHSTCLAKATTDHDAAVTQSKSEFDKTVEDASKVQASEDALAHGRYEDVVNAQARLVEAAQAHEDQMEKELRDATDLNNQKQSAMNVAVAKHIEQEKTHGLNTAAARENWLQTDTRIEDQYTKTINDEKAALTTARDEYEETQDWNIRETETQCAADAQLYHDELATVQSILAKMTNAMNRDSGSSLQFDGANANHYGTETNPLAK